MNPDPPTNSGETVRIRIRSSVFSYYVDCAGQRLPGRAECGLGPAGARRQAPQVRGGYKIIAKNKCMHGTVPVPCLARMVTIFIFFGGGGLYWQVVKLIRILRDKSSLLVPGSTI